MLTTRHTEAGVVLYVYHVLSLLVSIFVYKLL